jgi:hypothetical protein
MGTGGELNLRDMSMRQVPSPRRIGEPIHERRLTESLKASVNDILRPGAGRSVYVIEEADLGAGRPDVVLLAVSTRALAAFQSSGLRIPSPLAAKILDSGFREDELGVGQRHARSLRRDLEFHGWSESQAKRVAFTLHDSLGIEAKVKDWRQAIRQVSKFRRLFHRSAVLMPRRIMPHQSNVAMDFYGCGLLFQDASKVEWQRASTLNEPRVWARLWLMELLLRGLNDGTAHRAVDLRNAERASV